MAHKDASQSINARIAAATGMDVEEEGEIVDSMESIGENGKKSEAEQAHFDSLVPVSQGGRPLAPDDTGKYIDDSIRHVIITGKHIDNNKTKIQIDPTESVDILYNILGDYAKQCKPLRSGGLLIEVETFQQLKKLLSQKEFGDYRINVEVAELVDTIRVVIYEERLINKTED